MRTTTTAQDLILSKKHRSVSLRIFVDRGSGDWVNMATLEGRDWCHGITWGDSQDASVVTATITLWQKVEELSLSPLVDGSKLNASGTIVELGHAIYVETAVLPPDTVPAAGDWVEQFRGEIDAINWESSPMILRCRDNSGPLDLFIEAQRKVPFDLPVDRMEAAMQEILDFNFGTAVVTLYSINGTGATPFDPADSPEWFIVSYIQRKQPVLQALRAIADQIGWYVRQIWNDDTGAFQLTLYEPPRDRAARGALIFTGQPTAAQTFDLNATTNTAVASSPGTDDFEIGATVAATSANIAAMLLAGSEAANVSGVWVVPARSSIGSLTFSGNPVPGTGMSINGQSVLSTAGTPGANEFAIGGTFYDTADNLVATLNGTSGQKGNIRATRVPGTGQVKILWLAAGSAGDLIVFTEAMSGVTIDGSGTLGGFQTGHDGGVEVEWGTKGTAGNSITWTEALSNATADGSGTLGGTILGAVAGGDGFTFGPDVYEKPSKLSIDRAGIRNVLRVKYGVSQVDRTTVEVLNAASITKYGRRFMEIAEAGSSQIDTEGEARRMAEAIIEDLMEPDATMAIRVPYFWPVELTGDVGTFEANGYHFDTDQSLAVVMYRHQLGPKISRSELTVRGKPSGGFKRWLSLEARPGVEAQNSFYENASAEGVVVVPGMGLLVVTYDDPRGMSPPINDWALTYCHASTVIDFVPTVANRVAQGKVTRFEIGGLIPKETYYIKLLIIDSAGTVAATSTQVVEATEAVGPYHLNEDREYGVLVPNQDFGVATKDITAGPPDYWSVILGTWGASAGVYYSGTIHNTGQRSIAFDHAVAATKQITSNFFPISADGLYGVEMTLLRSAGTISGSSQIGIFLAYYDEDKASISTGPVANAQVSALSTTVWESFKQKGQKPPATARFAKIGITSGRTAGDTVIAYLDSAKAFRFLPSFEATRTTTAASIAPGPPSAWTTFTANVETYDYGAGYDNTTYTYTAPADGFFSFEANIEILIGKMTAGTWGRCSFYINGTTRLIGAMIIEGGGAVNDLWTHAIPVRELARGDTVVCQLQHTSTSTPAPLAGSYWTVKQLSET